MNTTGMFWTRSAALTTGIRQITMVGIMYDLQTQKSTSPFRRTLMFFAVIAAFIAPRAARAEQPFDYHTVRGRQPETGAAGGAQTGVREGESLPRNGTSRPQGMRGFGRGWSGDEHLLWDGKLGDAMRTSFTVDDAGRYRFSLRLTKAPDYGVFNVNLNGKRLREGVDTYDRRVVLDAELDLGEVTLPAGEQKLVMTLTGANPKARKFRGKGYLMGLDYLRLVRLDAPPKSKVAAPAPAAPKLLKEAPRVRLAEVRPLMDTFCHRCHGGKKTKGKVNLKKLATDESFLSQLRLIRKAESAVAHHEMPPEDEKQPTAAQRRKLTAFFSSTIDEYIRTSGTLPPVAMRRLNRYEYNNAVRDLLKLKGDIYPLPEKVIRASRAYFNPKSGRFPDSIKLGNRALGKRNVESQMLTGVVPFAVDLQSEHGFNNRGDELSVSPILLESFLSLARSVVGSPEFDRYSDLTSSLFQAPKGAPVEAQVRRAEAQLRPFLERAFRMPPSDATRRRYVDYFARDLAKTGSFKLSMKNVVAAVLASPRFLYLVERKPADKAEAPLSAHELAARLAMFLWSSIPDEALLGAARSGKLLNAKALAGQVDRMLEDPRSQALSLNFARQWLRLDQLITAVPDFERFPIYYSRIGCEQWKFGCQTMIEPLLLFESIMVEDRSVMLLVDSNYSYRSTELQTWYEKGVPFQRKGNGSRFNPYSSDFRRQKLGDRRQGGVITQAATLTMSSTPLRTRPISRGAWVATVIFNRPPEPPPDDVPSIEEDDAAIENKGVTLRQRLLDHQVNPSCVACHSKIDPLGFALENFDAIGRWRDTYRSGLKIDASGVLFGEAKFADPVGLKDAIMRRPEWFLRGFSEHLLSYSLGRELELYDRVAVWKIVQKALAARGQFSTIVQAIVASYPFRHKSAD
jgi:hypothetical protein